jgi:hypothetical protein
MFNCFPKRSLVCFAALGITAAFASNTDSSFQSLEPMSSFTLPLPEGTKLASVNPDIGGRCAVLCRGREKETVLSVDLDGSVRSSREILPTSYQDSAVVSSEVGDLAVYPSDGEVDLYKKNTLMAHAKIPTQSLGAAFLSGTLFQVGVNQVSAISNDKPLSTYTATRSFRWPAKVIPTSDHELSIVELENGTVTTFDSSTLSWQEHKLIAPELVSAPPSDNPDVSTPPIFTVAGDGRSRTVYAAANGFSVTTGLPIFAFSAEGELLARYRCKLPINAAVATPKNRDGHFSVSGITISNSRLIVYSQTQKLFLVYQLPSLTSAIAH